jgi:hypothetical protein
MKAVYDKLDLGLILDAPGWDLPPGAFTDSRNVRYRDGAAEKIRGHSQAFGDLSATANWIETITDGTNVFYVYADLGNIYATDGTTHSLISTISYSAGVNLSWSGGHYHGYLVLTDGVLDPQTWEPGLSNKVAGMDSTAGWPASTKCEIIRPFKDFIVAMKVTEAGAYNPRLLRWSESALAGNLPTTWDYTDPANDSGRVELGQTTDLLVDCLPLRDVNMVYKEQHTWIMEFIGGSSVFAFRQVFSQAGMLTQNCAAVFESRHFLVTDHDVIVHDGNDATSILDKKARRWLFNVLDSDNYSRSFVVGDYRNREMLFCFPQQGRSFANLALVWSWQDGSIYIRDLGTPMTHGVSGFLPSATAQTFDASSGSFEGETRDFDEQQYQASEQYIIFTDSAATKAYQNDDGEDFDGTSMSVYMERENLPLTKDISLFKRVMRVYPRVLGTQGDTIAIKIGMRDSLDGTVTWSSPQTFTIGTDYKVEFRESSRLFDIRFDYTGSNPLRVFGYEVEFEPEGYR